MSPFVERISCWRSVLITVACLSHGFAKSPAGQHPTCKLDEGDVCSMAGMPRDEITMVYPGGKTRCLFSDHSDYAFQVVPGHTDKLLIHFQGGGVCWDDLSTNVMSPRPCITDLKVQPLCGIFDRNRTDSPFRQHTVVHVQYCSGDLHVGDAVRWYLDPSGAAVEQRGYHNTRSAIDWARENVDKRLSSLVLSGCSAGAVGAQLWADEALRSFEYNSAVVLADSYLGILPHSAQGPLLKNFGTCRAGLLREELAAACEKGDFAIPDAFYEVMARFPDVAFANINSKADWSQIAFYKAIAQQNFLPADIDAASYLRRVNHILERYNAVPNYVSFLVTGTDNGFLPKPLLYVTSSEGVDKSAVPPLLATWLTDLQKVEDGQRVTNVCAGKMLLKADWRGTNYCDAAQAGKALSLGESQQTPQAASSHAAASRPTTTSTIPLLVEHIQDKPAWATAYYWVLGLLTVGLCAAAVAEGRAQSSRSQGEVIMSRQPEDFERREPSMEDTQTTHQTMHGPRGPLPPLRLLATPPMFGTAVGSAQRLRV